MENNNQTPQDEQGLDFWTNEALYFENAMKGLQQSYAIVASMHKTALQKIDELSPEREEVEQ